MSNKKELEKMQLDMFKSIYACKDCFKNFTPIEKLQFAQKAFLDVNKYSAEKFNYSQDEVMFGFFIRDKEGMALSYGTDVVAFDVRFILNCEKPSEIYRALFHESKHIHQHKEHTFAEKLSKKYGSVYNKSNTLWALGPSEIDADNYAYSQMSEIAKQGAKEFSEDRQANKIYVKQLATQVKEFGHVHKVAKAIVKDIEERRESKQSSKANSTNSRNAKSSNFFFNLQHIERVANNNPKLFSSCGNTNNQCDQIMQSIYDSEKEDYSKYHYSYPFFIIYAEENWNFKQAQNQVKPIEAKISNLLMSKDINNSMPEHTEDFFNNQEDSNLTILTNNENLNLTNKENSFNNEQLTPQGE